MAGFAAAVDRLAARCAPARRRRLRRLRRRRRHQLRAALDFLRDAGGRVVAARGPPRRRLRLRRRRRARASPTRAARRRHLRLRHQRSRRARRGARARRRRHHRRSPPGARSRSRCARAHQPAPGRAAASRSRGWRPSASPSTWRPRCAPGCAPPAGRALPDPRALVDLVAVGTIADLAPLTDENRILVHNGLCALRAAPRPGLARAVPRRRPRRTACSAPPTSGCAWRRASTRPAASATRSRRSICCSPTTTATPARAPPPAKRPTSSRREMQERVLDEAMRAGRERKRGARSSSSAAQGWHAGVVGIVAAKLVDRFAAPVAGHRARRRPTRRGSARTAAGFHLYRALHAAAPICCSATAATPPPPGSPSHARNLAELRTPPVGGRARSVRRRRAPLPRSTSTPRSRSRPIDELLAEEVGRLGAVRHRQPRADPGARGATLERARVVGEQPPAGDAARRPARARRHRLLARRPRSRLGRPRARPPSSPRSTPAAASGACASACAISPPRHRAAAPPFPTGQLVRIAITRRPARRGASS